MRAESGLANNLKATRTRLGLSQQQLAEAAGVTRQTIGGIESSAYAPSASVALRLAHALGCRVEDLFWLEDAPTTIVATSPDLLPPNTSTPVALAQIQGRWMAYPLVGEEAFRTEMIPADGIATATTDMITNTNQGGSLAVKLLDEPENLARTVVLAGCTPVISLWARTAERWYPGLRVHWRFANSLEALEGLARGEVHIAGIHLSDPVQGTDNAAYIRQNLTNLTDMSVILVHLGQWEEGLLIAEGNPKGIRSVADLARPDVKLINRERGSGARLLLDSLLAREGIVPFFLAPQSLNSQILDSQTLDSQTREEMGEQRGEVAVEARSHLAVARAVAEGRADVGVSVASVAQSYRLGFIPCHKSDYELAIRETEMNTPAVQQLLETLHHRWIRAQLQVLGGFDTGQTGEIRIVSPA